jgi:hypothetical protein
MAVLALESPQPLTVADGAADWNGSALATLDVDASRASVAMHSPRGRIERNLKLQDGGDGVMHYVSEDGSSRAELSVNPVTQEYFYRESGIASGKPYTLQTHGWLKAVVAGM